MNIAAFRAALMVSVTGASPALAGELLVQPVQVGRETVRYLQGVATVDLQGRHGAVQVTPLPMDHGGLSFSIAVLNDGDQPTNIDIDSFRLTTGTQVLGVLSKDKLVKNAKSRAMWMQIGLAALGGAAAGAAASQRDVYHSALYTPRGTYRAVYSGPSAAGQFQAAAIGIGTGVAIAGVQNRLDQTRVALGNNIVQLTTIDPGEGYAGQIIVEKIKTPKYPQRVDVVVHWNGENYPFAFQAAKEGTPAPRFAALMPVEGAPEAQKAVAAVSPPVASVAVVAAITPVSLEQKSR
jgi:hypothetical protein